MFYFNDQSPLASFLIRGLTGFMVFAVLSGAAAQQPEPDGGERLKRLWADLSGEDESKATRTLLALTAAPKVFTYTKDDFSMKIQLDPIAFRAQALSE